MSNLNIANRYARALMDLAVNENSLDAISADIELINNTLRSSRQLQLTLTSPVVKSEVKHSILTEIFQNRITPVTLSFIQFVINKNREDLLTNIVKQFLAFRDRKLGITSADIISAEPLNDEQKNRLVKRLEGITGKKVRVNYSLNNSIIGGFVIRIEDTVYDASVKHQLDLLKDKLLQENYSMN
ncbi:MAG: ATP synthase F1 subunit delta [Bacillota bacterium]